MQTKRVARGSQCGYMLNELFRCRKRTRIFVALQGKWIARCVIHRKEKYLGR